MKVAFGRLAATKDEPKIAGRPMASSRELLPRYKTLMVS